MASSVTNLTRIFIPPPPGIPNFKLPISSDGHYTRQPYKGAKTMQCFFYALRLLLDTKNRPELHQKISPYRKAIDASHVQRELLLKIVGKTPLEENEKALAEKPLLELHTISEVIAFLDTHPIVKYLNHDILTTLHAFTQQTEWTDVSDFIEQNHHKELIKVNQRILKEFKDCEEENDVDPRKAVENAFSRSFEEMSLILQRGVFDHKAYKGIYQAYGCKRSAWHPAQPIERLIEQLRLHGPHLISGLFSKKCYSVPAEIKICAGTKNGEPFLGRNVYGWLPKHRIASKNLGTVHSMLIVGAQTTGRYQHVFLINPSNKSIPGDPLSQKIYAISYKTLQTYIVSISTGLFSDPSPSGAIVYPFAENLTGPNDYAIHC